MILYPTISLAYGGRQVAVSSGDDRGRLAPPYAPPVDAALGDPLPRVHTFVVLLAVLPALVLLPAAGFLLGRDAHAQPVLAVTFIALTALFWLGAWLFARLGVLVGHDVVSRTCGDRATLTIPFDELEQVEVRPRYGDVQIVAWTTRAGRRVAVMATPLTCVTRPLLESLRGEIDRRPELLATDQDREHYAWLLKHG